MADNYIERKYEEYEAKKAAWLKKQKHAIKRKPAIQPQKNQETKKTEEKASDDIQ